MPSGHLRRHMISLWKIVVFQRDGILVGTGLAISRSVALDSTGGISLLINFHYFELNWILIHA